MAARNWATFATLNHSVIEAAGLPQVEIESINHWDDFLMHGCLDHHDDATGFTVDQLSNIQNAALVQFVDSYFDSRHEYFTPMALRNEDREGFRNAQPWRMMFLGAPPPSNSFSASGD